MTEDQPDLLSPIDDLGLVKWLVADLHDDLNGKIARFRQLEHRSVIRNRKGDSQRVANHDSPCSEVNHGQAVLVGFAWTDHRIH